MFRAFTACLLLCLPIVWGGDPCPSKAELRSCTCKQIFVDPTPNSTLTTVPSILTTVNQSPQLSPSSGSLYTVVDCRVPKTITALEEAILFALHRKAVDRLTVSNVPPMREHTLARLPSGWLKNTRVKQFEVQDTLLSGDFIWYNDPFEGQSNSLLWFSAKRCYLSGALTFDVLGTVNTKGLNLLPLIEGVDLSHNQLTLITNNGFKNPPNNLSTLVLAYNSIQRVEGGAFQHIPNLKMMNLSHNLLEVVARNVFASPAKNLESIDLSWNLLASLPSDFFHNMPSLKVVNLSKNFLFSLPQKPWSSIWRQLALTDLSGNFIACDCNLLWLLPIIQGHNETHTTAPHSFPEQTIKGSCTMNDLPAAYTTQHDLVDLTRDKLLC